MQYEEFRRVVVHPFWTLHPQDWSGIAVYAKHGRVGMFNLSWLMVNTNTPPAPVVYHQRDLVWIEQHAEKMQVGGCSLERQAAFLPLWAFCDVLKYARETRSSLQLKCLLHNGLRKLERSAVQTLRQADPRR